MPPGYSSKFCPGCNVMHRIRIGTRDELQYYRATLMGRSQKDFFCNSRCFQKYYEKKYGTKVSVERERPKGETEPVKRNRPKGETERVERKWECVERERPKGETECVERKWEPVEKEERREREEASRKEVSIVRDFAYQSRRRASHDLTKTVVEEINTL